MTAKRDVAGALLGRAGPVLVVVLSKVHVYGDDGSVLEKHEAFSLVPNALVNVRIAEGPRDRS